MSDSELLEICATPKVLERVFFALDQLKKHPDRSASEINARIAKKFERPLSNSHWTVLNRARREGRLEEVVTAPFDFKRHGRETNTSPKSKTRAERSVQSMSVESKLHARYLVAVWGAGAASHIPCKTKKDVQNELRRLMGKGIAIKDIAVYAVEPFALQVSVRI